MGRRMHPPVSQRNQVSSRNLVSSAVSHENVGKALLLAHLALSPLVFCTATVEVFEFNKVALLHATGIALAACLLGGPHLRFGLAQLRSLLAEPIGAGFLLYLLSAGASTVTSLSPVTSLW